jgi:hypothetical protein
VVLDTFSRLVLGWAVDSTQTTALVLNPLGMATQRREHRDGLIIDSDRGMQFTSWAFSDRVRHAIAPSMGAIGTAAKNAIMESFWGRMQVELLNRRRWKTRIELATAIHDYIELWHNSRRRHSALGMLTPTEVEAAWAATRTDAVAHAGLAKTAPTTVVDEAASSGLPDPQAEAVHADHQHLLLNNDQATWLQARDEFGHDLGGGLVLFGERNALPGPQRQRFDLTGRPNHRGRGGIAKDRLA